jgi:hypothetical protein
MGKAGAVMLMGPVEVNSAGQGHRHARTELSCDTAIAAFRAPPTGLDIGPARQYGMI